MRVLLTNNTLDVRAGTELYVRDVALELMRRGHQPVAYSTRLGSVAEELRAATVPVISSLETLGEVPDVIHGHHHYETLTALLWFPETPAIYYCHGWLPWEEAPLRHPRILRYAAVSEVGRERLIVEGGIAPEQIEIIPNFVDPNRFPQRLPLPSVPRRALAFGNDFYEEPDLAVMRETCGDLGIKLDAVGFGVGNPVTDPGPLLAQYDIVFARGRAALEAMAVGAAVILGNRGRLGPLVTTENFATLRRFNFALRTLSSPTTPELLTSELQRYRADSAMAVSRMVREQCLMGPAVDRIVDLYHHAISEWRENSTRLSVDGMRAAARYMEKWAPHYKAFQEASDRGLRQRDARIAVLQRELAALRDSASWRWTQAVLQHWLIRGLFGRWIERVARRSVH